MPSKQRAAGSNPAWRVLSKIKGESLDLQSWCDSFIESLSNSKLNIISCQYEEGFLRIIETQYDVSILSEPSFLAEDPNKVATLYKFLYNQYLTDIDLKTIWGKGINLFEEYGETVIRVLMGSDEEADSSILEFKREIDQIFAPQNISAYILPKIKETLK